MEDKKNNIGTVRWIKRLNVDFYWQTINQTRDEQGLHDNKTGNRWLEIMEPGINRRHLWRDGDVVILCQIYAWAPSLKRKRSRSGRLEEFHCSSIGERLSRQKSHSFLPLRNHWLHYFNGPPQKGGFFLCLFIFLQMSIN